MDEYQMDNRVNAKLGVTRSDLDDAKNANWNLNNLLNKALNRPSKEVPAYIASNDPSQCVQGAERARIVNQAGYSL